MSIFKKLAGQTALYGISSILGRTLNFLLTPILATYLAVGEFGVSVDIYSIAAVLNVIYLFGFETTYFRFAKKENAIEPEVFNQIESTLLLSSAIFSALLALCAVPIAQFLEYPDHTEYIYYLAAILFFDSIVAIPFARLRLANNAIQFASIKTLNIVLNIALCIFFIAVCKTVYESGANGPLSDLIKLVYTPGNDVKYVFVANLISNALVLPLFYKSFLGMKFKIDTKVFKEMFRYAYPLVILGVAGMTNEMLSRLIFKKVLPDGLYPELTKQEALGVFGACYKLSMFMSLAIQSFRYAAEPFFFSQATEKNSPQTFALVMKWFIIVCLGLFLMISLNIELLGKIMLRKEAYQMGLQIVPILLLANMFLGICFNLSIGFKLTDRTIYGTYISLGGVAITIIFNLLLIPKYGFTGSAITTLICYASMAVATYWWGRKNFPIPYYVMNAAYYIALALVMVYFNSLLVITSYWQQLGLSVILLLAFTGTVFLNEKKALN